jgi:hypothetical protein
MGIGSTQQERSRSDNRQCRHQCTSIEPTVILPRQHQTFEVTNEHEHVRAFLDPIAFRVNVLPGLGGVILVIFRRGLALKEEREPFNGLMKEVSIIGAQWVGCTVPGYLTGTMKRIQSLV